MDGIELMATALHAARARLDVAASNLANVSSAGFRRVVARAGLDGTGLHVARTRDAARGPLERTGRGLDFAATAGGFFVRDADGRVAVARSGSFAIAADGTLADERGRLALGSNGPLRVSAEPAVEADGSVRDAGGAQRLRTLAGTTIRAGFIERPNVDAIREMVDVLDAQRAFETAQKTLSAIDDARAKDANDVVRVKS